jgi:uncharacterized protein
MKLYLSTLLAGVLFGSGLAISGMTDPARVTGFLDIAGQWDMTLMFVMGAALIVTRVSPVTELGSSMVC